MHIIEAMTARHATRAFDETPISDDQIQSLKRLIGRLNAYGDLDMQLIHDETDAFGGCPTHYGRFRNVRWCAALIGTDKNGAVTNSEAAADGDTTDGDATGTGTVGGDTTGGEPGAVRDLDWRVGYFGELFALGAVSMGLDTGWAVLHETNDHHGSWRMLDGERMPAVIAIGHATRPGVAHRAKSLDLLGAVESGTLADAPAWFVAGLSAAALAPSALGKQPFRFTLLADRHTVRAEALEGVQAEIGLGIAMCHFELGACHGNLVDSGDAADFADTTDFGDAAPFTWQDAPVGPAMTIVREWR